MPHLALRRASVAALVAVFCLSLLPFGSARAGDAPAPDLLPDLTTRRPDDLSLDTDEIPGRTLLRFTNEVLNRGAGPLELAPRAEDCNGNGDPDDDRRAYQNIFQDTNANEMFDRATSTHEGDVPREVPAGCSSFHVKHNHWHFEEFATYELYRMNELGEGEVRAGGSDKISFCLLDSNHVKIGLPGASTQPFYGRFPIFCDQDEVTGISVGWSDIYTSSLADQWIDVTGLERGRYCLWSTVDPATTLDATGRIEEVNDANNSRGLRLRLTRKTVEWAPRRGCTVAQP